VVCNYTIRADLDRAFEQSGAKKVFVFTDYFGADAINAAKKAGVDHLIFMSVADAEFFNENVKHLKAKVALEKYLRESGVPFSILQTCAFFENLDDAAKWNPLKKRVVKFLTIKDCKYCATYDIGRVVAIHFKNPQEWLGKTLDVNGWQGDLSLVAFWPVPRSVACRLKPSWQSPFFYGDYFCMMHHMFLYYEVQKSPRGTPQEFKKILTDALLAEDWFRIHGRYSNGEKTDARA